MRKSTARLLWAALLGWSCAAEAAGWRGDGSGAYPGARPPPAWDGDNGQNVVWRAAVGKGQATPVVVGDRLFVTAEPDWLVCVGRASGKVLWKNRNGYDAVRPTVAPPARPPKTAPGCGYASASPASDGKSVFASFGTGIVACYGLDGNRQWARWLDLPQASEFGRAASPVLADGKLLVSIGGLEALDPATGKVLWQAPAAKPTYGTPAVVKIGATDVAITSGGHCVRTRDGAVLADKLPATQYTSPLVRSGVVYYAAAPAAAVRLPEEAAETLRPEKLWENDDVEGEFFASPVWHDGILYLASNEGVLYALDAASGKTVFQKELEIRSASGKPGKEPANVYPSLVLAGGKLFVGNDAGETLVLEPGREYKEAGRNYLDKGCGASPVPDGATLFLRGGELVYAIGAK